MCFTFTDHCISQNEIAKDQNSPTGRLSVIGGMGNYEYLHVGLNVVLKHKYYFETAVGIKPWGFRERYMMGYICFGGRFLKEKEKIKKLKPYLHLKLLCWDLDNAYNHFLFLGINPEIRIAYTLKKRLQLCGNIGGAYNTKLYYKRKTYEEVGWPKEWQPSFSIQFLYLIK
ncbi:MAG: hypothetical protein H0W84_00480 [Bacteroidetes bacterium]|nr:hypothetical protein [Bacteroidota bacterium]